jgi:2'-hydroxyisoflavone reductase
MILYTMKLLVLGGTVFVGRAIVEAALARGHEVTLFNRGTRGRVFEGVEEIHGDRSESVDALQGQWDWVIDTSGYVPRVVRMSAQRLRGQAARYLFISTISVYRDNDQPGINEESPLAVLEKETEEINGETYGGLKVLCEQETLEAYPEALIIRPGLIIGPHDSTDRFTYWVMRAADGGDILVPGRLEQPTQYIDVRDLAEWTLDMIERNAGGIYNATGPARPDTLGGMINSCLQATDAESRLVPVPEDFLLELGVTPFKDLPFWLAAKEGGDGLMQVNNSKAHDAGLTSRPLVETVRDTYAWRKTLDQPLKVGLSREREQELLRIVGAQ